MTRYEKILTFDVDNMAWFIQTLLEETEDNMLNKLAEYGLEVSVVTLDKDIRHAKIINDLLEEQDGSDT